MCAGAGHGPVGEGLAASCLRRTRHSARTSDPLARPMGGEKRVDAGILQDDSVPLYHVTD
jgi:hypothetical protein